jgi:hypothetical protein
MGRIDDRLAGLGLELPAVFAAPPGVEFQFDLARRRRRRGWLKVLGLVNCAPAFNAMPAVINGFSDLILGLWGDRGNHARSAIGGAELPFDIQSRSKP